MFPDPAFVFHRVEELLNFLSFMLPSFTLVLRDEVSGRAPRTFCSPGGVADLARQMRFCSWSVSGDPVVLRAERHDALGPWMKVELTLRWEPTRDRCVYGYTNGVPNYEGGAHLRGLRRSLAGCLTVYAIEAGLRRGDQLPICPREASAGLTALVSLWHCDARYSSATRGMLVSTEASTFVADAINRRLFAWLQEHPREASAIVRHVLRRGRT